MTEVFAVVNCLLLIGVFTMQIVKLRMHRRLGRLVTETLRKFDDVVAGAIAVQHAYNALAASHKTEAARTLVKVERAVEAGVTAAAEVATKLAEAQSNSGSFVQIKQGGDK